MKELEQAARPVKPKATNPFPATGERKKGIRMLDSLQPSSSTAGPSLVRKRSVDAGDEADIEEIAVLPAEKKTRVAPKEKYHFMAHRQI